MDPQEIFDTVATHLFAQGERAYDGSGCCYRLALDDGTILKCAAGCLIDDEIYIPAMEHANISMLLFKFEDVLPPWFVEHRELINDLQLAHDCNMKNEGRSFKMNVLKASLQKVARKYSLKMAE